MDVYFNNPFMTYCIVDFEKLGRVNLLQGDSGTGKTTLCEIVAYYTFSGEGITEETYNGDLPLYLLSNNETRNADKILADLESLEQSHLVIADEESPLINNDFTNIDLAIHSTSHKFLIMTRKVCNNGSLPISSENIYTVDYDEVNEINYIRKRFNEFYTMKEPKIVDTAFLEDGVTSYQFFKSYFNNIVYRVVNGKDNLSKKLERNTRRAANKGEKVIISVLDLLSYGSEYSVYKDLIETYKAQGKELYTVNWGCFEEYILRSPNFDQSLTAECITEKDYTKELKKVLPEEKYTRSEHKKGYDKSTIGDCLTADYDCQSCERYSICKIKVKDKRANYIHSDLQYIREGSNTPISQHLTPNTNTSQIQSPSSNVDTNQTQSPINKSSTNEIKGF